MRQVQARITARREVADGIYLVNLLAPEIASGAKSGQFVHVRPAAGWDPLLRRPLSLCRIGGLGSGLLADEISLLFEEVGRGTEQLARLQVGQFLDVLGPLGNGFSVRPDARRVLLVAGGLGIAPLIGLAEYALSQEMAVVLLAGALSAKRLLPAELVPPEVEYVVATDDGSVGHKGFVTDLIAEYLPWADQLFTCGPRPMFASVLRELGDSSIPAQASLESRMGCGVGACLGCVIETRKGRQRVCREGPVFDLRDVV